MAEQIPYDTVEFFDDGDKERRKWIVIAFAGVCILILVVCIILIIVVSLKRTGARRPDLEYSDEEEGEDMGTDNNSKLFSKKNHRSSKKLKDRKRKDASPLTLVKPNAKDAVVKNETKPPALSTVSEKSEILEATSNNDDFHG